MVWKLGICEKSQYGGEHGDKLLWNYNGVIRMIPTLTDPFLEITEANGRKLRNTDLCN